MHRCVGDPAETTIGHLAFGLPFACCCVDLHTYQSQSRRTARYPDAGANPIYPTLGLCGEAGEVADKVKKVIRDRGGEFSPEVKRALELELGDVLWYVAQLATELGLDLEQVAQANLDKLASRAARDVIGGEGDER
jgi:NTP pyrophosphatase (non-canonical NTP hydrolase)